jgi:WD40 repeat protein
VAVDEDEEDRLAGVTYLYGHTAPVFAVDWSHDTRLLFSGSGDGTVRMWSRCV